PPPLAPACPLPLSNRHSFPTRRSSDLDNAKDLIPFTFNKGEHGIGFMRQARFTHYAHSFSHSLGHLGIRRIGNSRSYRKRNNHAHYSTAPQSFYAARVVVPNADPNSECASVGAPLPARRLLAATQQYAPSRKR